MSYKTAVKRSFNRAHSSYDQSCELQQTICQTLLTLTTPWLQSADCLVDLGCGTGNSTLLLQKNIEHHTLLAIDWSDQLLDTAKKKNFLPNSCFIEQDFDRLELPHHSVDLFFSNMSLQWSNNFPALCRRLAKQLTKQGRLIFSMPLANSFNELKSEYKHQFYTIDDIISSLKHEGFVIQHITAETKTLKFSNPLSALNSIKNVGANVLNHTTNNKALGLSTLKSLSNHFISPKKNQLTYHIGYFIAQKKA